MSQIYFTSDTHYNHKNIVRGTTSWDIKESERTEQRVRDFDTLEEHNATLIKNINSVVKHDDTLWHLGDWSFGGKDSIKTFRDQLECRNIHLVFGNHDQHIEPLDSPYRPLFSSVQYYKELHVSDNGEKRRIVLLHFALRIWNKAHHGAIHLYGHSHNTIPDFGKSMDVGVDTNDLKPYSLTQILEIMRKRETPVVDHHNKNTN